ncbi:MAG: Rad52/Rad22 family DNA repair protein [Armatimonadota bacterium]|nr:Rad52/Rad22 family DNA repair protein [Armatimonadota bacterium]
MFDAQALAKLLEPFPAEKVQWKPGAISPDRTRALGLAYVDQRDYMARLDEVDPAWQDEYQVITAADRVMVVCRLTVQGITRTGDGEAPLTTERGEQDENALTSASAQAFKRACAKFGLGRYLYEVPKVWAEYDPDKRAFTREGLARLYALLGKDGDRPSEPPAPTDSQPAATNGGQSGQSASQNGDQNRRPAPSKPSNHRPAQPNGQSVVVRFGKYSGKTLEQIAREDPEYLKWLAENWQWEPGRAAARAMVAQMEKGGKAPF